MEEDKKDKTELNNLSFWEIIKNEFKTIKSSIQTHKQLIGLLLLLFIILLASDLSSTAKLIGGASNVGVPGLNTAGLGGNSTRNINSTSNINSNSNNDSGKQQKKKDKKEKKGLSKEEKKEKRKEKRKGQVDAATANFTGSTPGFFNLIKHHLMRGLTVIGILLLIVGVVVVPIVIYAVVLYTVLSANVRTAVTTL